MSILNWVTKHSPIDDHTQIQEEAHLLDAFQSAGAWFFERSEFFEWESGIKNEAAPKFSVLWVR